MSIPVSQVPCKVRAVKESLRLKVWEKLMQERILRRPEVQHRTGLSRSTIYVKMAAGAFPKPLPLGVRAVGWAESEITAWLEGRKAERAA
jgi:prophage regulatory protein